ncbi:MAG TPA: DegT/DnrJ/EryC1/StrS family aminotransferase [Rhizomicrobium sp.]|nr:DegT/DnrJ/EryC1/StrS family aminotransferase [Rhizomicrobium sp.]
MSIPFLSLRDNYAAYQAELDAAVRRVLDSGWYILGKELEAFEAAFAAWNGSAHCIGVANGTDAIALALRSLGIGLGDSVATVSHTAVATVAAIEMTGAAPLLVDISPDTYTLDPQKLDDSLKRHPVRAVIAVHLYGHPCDVDAIRDVCARHGAALIEDCAQAHGAMLDGRKAGTMGDMAAFSFYPTKNLGAFGDGGGVVTNDPELSARCAALRQYGWRERYLSDLEGVNSRLDELQAALLAVKLKHLDAEIAARRQIATRYDQALGDAVSVPVVKSGVAHAYHLYVVRSGQRDALTAHLKQAGIGTAVHYPLPVHLQAAYKGRVALGHGGMTQTEAAMDEILSLPMHPFLAADAQDQIIAAVRSF